MFGFNKKKVEKKILAPQNGIFISLEEVPDEVFAQKMLGDGVAIIPDSNDVCSPVDGTIVQIPETLHAYGIHTDDGLDILVHIGINTVELKGEGFESLVKEGDKVKAGEIIARADLDFIKNKGYATHTPILITNIDDIKSFSNNSGKAKACETVAITYVK